MLPEVKDGPALLRVPSEERPSPFREWLQAQSWPSYPTEMRYTSEYETSELRAIVAGHWYGIIQKALIWVGGANEISARNSMGKAPGIVGKKVVNDMIGFCALNTAFSCDLHDISQSNTPDEYSTTGDNFTKSSSSLVQRTSILRSASGGPGDVPVEIFKEQRRSQLSRGSPERMEEIEDVLVVMGTEYSATVWGGNDGAKRGRFVIRAKIYVAALTLTMFSLGLSFIPLSFSFPPAGLYCISADMFRPWLMVKSLYLRVTLNYVTLAFFLFSFGHCFTQGILQSFLYTADDTWGALTSSIIARANISSTIFPQYTGRHGAYSLELCNQVPAIGGDPHPCVPFFTAGQAEPITIPQRYLPPDSQAPESGDSFQSIGPSGSQSDVTSARWLLDSSLGVQIDSQPNPDGFSDVIITSSDGSMFLTIDPVCTFSLLYPEAKLSQSRREELSLVGTQFWFFGLAVFALAFESIPHILALVIARFIATGWSTYSLWRTMNIKDRLQHVIEDPDTPCHLDLYGPYFTRRVSLQLADLILHWDALFISIILSWRLYKVYRTHTFRRVGPPKDVLRMYAYFLAVLVSIQLSVFILVNAMALWVDQLLHGAIKKLSSHTVVYDGTFITTTVLLIPWLMMGWFSVRRESRKLTVAFLAVAFFFLFAWSMMFYSRIYRFTFVDWPFFGCMTVTSFVTLISATSFAFVCLRNYGKGLAQWLYLEESFRNDDFDPDLFPTEVTEKEWKPGTNRASISKVALPDLLRADTETGAV